MTTFATLLKTFIELSDVFISPTAKERFRQIWDAILVDNGWTREQWDTEVQDLMGRLSELGLNDVQSTR